MVDGSGVHGKRPRQFAYHEIMFQALAFVFARADLTGEFVFSEREEHRRTGIFAMVLNPLRNAPVTAFCYDAAPIVITICFY